MKLSAVAFLSAVAAFGLSSCAGLQRHKDRTPAPSTSSIISISHGHGDGIKLVGPSADLRLQLPEYCLPSKSDASAGGLLVGLVLDWIFGSMVTAVSKKVEEAMKHYSASYKSDAVKGFLDGDRWKQVAATKEQPGYATSCIVVQRVVCPGKTKNPLDDGCKVALSIGLEIRERQSFLEARPVALTVSTLKPRHGGGKASIAVGLRLDDVSYDPVSGGEQWTTGEVVLLNAICAAKKATSSDASTVSTCDFKAPGWDKAVILPRPPLAALATAATVSVAEVGTVPNGLKLLASFLKAKGEAAGGVLSSAVKKKLDVPEK